MTKTTWTVVREAITKNADKTITRNIIQTIEKTFASKGAANSYITRMDWKAENTGLQILEWKAVTTKAEAE